MNNYNPLFLDALPSSQHPAECVVAMVHGVTLLAKIGKSIIINLPNLLATVAGS